ncbi:MULTISPECIES: TerC family protein [unclassified Staphylococcus]|uniref:TerC family protein n=1 Tax=unclassified Staphylococcus TaxID=91994 RepID=UPI0021CED238|nr:MULTISPECIES: TerC family protein [unclassified Staphylococcus]UXR70138.1 TerC family protein [Staphylococcus sp. IVB6246]UXR72197.1 TerC family protein [Staphylococcus sp. IVB6240]UXR74506.1 TerC family protein [Staphylococcus sp. IVB6238]UXR76890.1 TerC family protein [Staphylococcus sp. IVB6233]UXR81016.1 TerC family protein [Staphylococcus sp. IVB6218]
MDPSLILSYGWVVLVLVFLEGLLAADNAIVMAVMVRHLPPKQRKKALFYGLLGAFVFRFLALFLISILANFWWIQALGAAYLLFMSAKNLYQFFRKKDADHSGDELGDDAYNFDKEVSPKEFWGTVAKVEFADIAFAIDSMLAALAIAVTLPEIGVHFGGMDAGQFGVMLTGGLIGVILMRFAATFFVEFLNKYPGLEGAAFAIVGWVGIKLVILVLAHEDIALIPHDFPHSATWQIIFWVVMIGLVVLGWFTSVVKNKKEDHS